MKLLNDLFSTDYGLMSVAVIAITLCMAAFFLRLFLSKMKEPPKPDPAAAARAAHRRGVPAAR
jgi:hypothetical protein